MYKKRKYFIILSLLLVVTLTLVGCNGSDPVSDATDDLVYEEYTTEDFSFKYPSTWTTSTNSETISSLRSEVSTDIYASGVHLEGESYGQQYVIIAFDYSTVDGATELTEENLDMVTNEFYNIIDSGELEPSASIQETSSLNLDGNPARKIIFDYYNGEFKKDMKVELILSIKGYKLFLIMHEASKDNYSDSIGMFTEIKDSTNLY